MIIKILIIVIFCLILKIIYKYVLKIYRVNQITKAVPPLFYNLPFLGVTYKFIGNEDNRKVFFDVVTSLKDLRRVKVWLGTELLILTTVPEDVKVINNVYIERPFFFRYASPWLGNGLITATGDIWKKSIKQVTAAVSCGVVDNFQPIFNAQSIKFVDQLKQELNLPPFDIFEKYILKTTLQSICQTALGVTDTANTESDQYYKASTTCLQLLVKRVVTIFYYPEFIYKLTPDSREFHKSIGIIHKLSKDIIAKKRKERENNNNNGSTVATEKIKCYLDVLMEMSEDSRLSDEQLRAEVDTIISSGQETSAISLNLILVMLARHPAVQQKAQNELQEIFGDSERPVQKEDLPKMSYCEAIINETIRLYPPVFAYFKETDKDQELDGWTVPKDAHVMMPLWLIARSKSNYGEDAEDFKPERWLDKNAPIPASLSSFGCGRRPCIGKRYALNFLKTILAHCLRQFEFLPEQRDLQFVADLTLRATSGHFVSVRSRRQCLTEKN